MSNQNFTDKLDQFCAYLWHSNKASKDDISVIKSYSDIFEAAMIQKTSNPDTIYNDDFVFEFIENLEQWLEFLEGQAAS